MIDLTQIGQTETKPDVEKLDDNNFIINGHAVKRSSTSKQEMEASHFTIDKFVDDGQLAPLPDDGKIDPNTTFIPDDKNAL